MHGGSEDDDADDGFVGWDHDAAAASRLERQNNHTNNGNGNNNNNNNNNNSSAVTRGGSRHRIDGRGSALDVNSPHMNSGGSIRTSSGSGSGGNGNGGGSGNGVEASAGVDSGEEGRANDGGQSKAARPQVSSSFSSSLASEALENEGLPSAQSSVFGSHAGDLRRLGSMAEIDRHQSHHPHHHHHDPFNLVDEELPGAVKKKKQQDNLHENENSEEGADEDKTNPLAHTATAMVTAEEGESGHDPTDLDEHDENDDNWSSDEDGEDDDDEGDVWSVRVRLISAVDLPPSLTPNTPLCPLLKFGLITSRNVGDIPEEPDPYGGMDHTLADDRSVKSEKSSRSIADSLREELVTFTQSHKNAPSSSAAKSHRHDKTDHHQLHTTPDNAEQPASDNHPTLPDDDDDHDNDNDDDDDDDEENDKKKSPSIVDRLEQTGLCSIPKARVRSSSGKILSPRDNGSMEWHEELRWDGVRRPLQTVLAVELCARAVLPPPPPPPSPNPALNRAWPSSGTNDDPSDLQTQPISEAAADNHPPGGDDEMIEMDSLGPVGKRKQQQPSASRRSALSDERAPPTAANAILGANFFGGPANQGGSTTPPSEPQAHSREDDQQRGFRGFWRKGRVLDQNRPRIKQAGNTSEMESATAAAAVATYLMESGDSGYPPRQSSGNEDAPSGYFNAGADDEEPDDEDDYSDDEQQQQQRQRQLGPEEEDVLGGAFDDVLSSWKTRKKRPGEQIPSGGTGVVNQFGKNAEGQDGVGQSGGRHRPRKKRKVQLVDDLRLGSLVIPLSRLPLEDATCSENGEAVVEKWFQLDTTKDHPSGGGRNVGPAPHTLPQARHSSISTASTSATTASSLLSPRRCPSVLLEISFCSAETLDDSEDEADAGDEGDIMWEQQDGKGERRPSLLGGYDSQQSFPNDPESAGTIGGGLKGAVSGSNLKTGNDSQSALSSSGLDDPSQRDGKKGKKGSSAEDAAKEAAELAKDGPELVPGVVDYICVVGARDIGTQQNDDGAKGWVNSSPECCILEQFPPNDKFHSMGNRNALLADKVEWFCFPDGWKLWRGPEPPSHNDLNLKRFSASSPPSVASSIAAFDACLNCTTSFTWFVMSSTAEDYASKNVKTYGAVIRFYAPAPPGVDRTQDDYAQTGSIAGLGGESSASNNHKSSTIIGKGGRDQRDSSTATKRLWVPMGILLTSNFPIVGALEAILLRLCETLAANANSVKASASDYVSSVIRRDISNLIVNFQAPIPGVVHSSVPFLSGERLHLTVPPLTGLPPLPHGAAVTSVCRLLGADGFNVMLAAVLTECKILIHSADVANLAMVAEVITALIFPFDWALPYIPVLPEAMLEFIEAPLSYFLGVPSCNMKWIDKSVLHDVVVIDLDNGLSSPDSFEGRRGPRSTKMPTPLPVSVATNISKAVARLIKAEEEIEEEFASTDFFGSRPLPRLEGESLAERQFRIAVALQLCSLVRGYHECLFFVTASQPVFNRDRFLRHAPALFEERRGNIQVLAMASHGASGAMPSTGSATGGPSQRILSPRSKRFLSNLVNTQHFHALLERLDIEWISFFHEIMDALDRFDDSSGSDSRTDRSNPTNGGYGSVRYEDAAAFLSESLDALELKIPTYRVERTCKKQQHSKIFDADDDYEDSMNGFDDILEGRDPNDEDMILSYEVDDDTYAQTFTHDLLRPIVVGGRGDGQGGSGRPHGSSADDLSDGSDSSSPEGGVHTLSVQYLLELEKSPWRYCKMLEIPLPEDSSNDEPPDEILETKPHDDDDINNYFGNYDYKHSDGERSGEPASAPLAPVSAKIWPTIKLKTAIGERRFRQWKSTQEEKLLSGDEGLGVDTTGDPSSTNENNLDLTSLLSSAADDAENLTQASPHSRLGARPSITGGNSGGIVSIEQQRVHDAKDRDVLRRCLERAYEGSSSDPPSRVSRFGRRGSAMGSASPGPADTFNENGVDLITEAEAALRNPSAQRFLISVLSQRSRLENQRRRRQGQAEDLRDGVRHRQTNQSSVSRLQPSAFECLVRLCRSMLDACQETHDYESAYKLLTHTAGFCKVVKTNNSGVTPGAPAGGNAASNETGEMNTKIIYMTAQIGSHPIFADLRLWERVLLVHQQENSRQKDKSSVSSPSSGGNQTLPGSNSGAEEENNPEVEEYEAAVSTLYEMVGYGVPAEELAKFATRVSEERGWFATERGQALLMLARRLSVRRDEGEDGTGDGDLDLMATAGGKNSSSSKLMTGQLGSVNEEGGKDISKRSLNSSIPSLGGGLVDDRDKSKTIEWDEIAWSHPAAEVSSALRSNPRRTNSSGGGKGSEGRGRPARSRQGNGGYNILGNMLGNNNSQIPGSGRNSRDLYQEVSNVVEDDAPQPGESGANEGNDAFNADDDVIEFPGYAGRTAVTCLASFGSSVVASGALDGSVFLAHTVKFPTTDDESCKVAGVRLEWGTVSGSSRSVSFSPSSSGVGIGGGMIDGDFGVGAVSCLAAARGAGYRQSAAGPPVPHGHGDSTDEGELLSAMEGCRVVAGTTGGDLRVWSVKDVYATTLIGSSGTDAEADVVANAMADLRIHHGTGGGESATSNYVRSGSVRGDPVGIGAGRLKQPLKGRPLGGHRGGVTCVDVPSHIYRPDALVSGGADGLIKLWSLRQPTNRRVSKTSGVGPAAARHTMASAGGQASVSRLLGGRQTNALSVIGTGDIDKGRGKSSAGTEPLEVLTGHGGRILCVKTAWHGDRLLSGGADRTVRLWDLAGSGGKCLHTMHGHLGWVNQAHYWGPHTIVSASTDRSIALWDSRVGASPLFVLRYHLSPVSDLLVGSRTEFLMVSAGADGAVATWDFRTLSGSVGGKDPSSPANGGGSTSNRSSGRRYATKTVREPVATMNHCQEGRGVKCSGSVFLARGAGLYERSVLSASVDGKLKEWDMSSGQFLSEQPTGHTDVVSSLTTFAESDGLRRGGHASGIKQVGGTGGGGDFESSNVGGIITTSWDGTVRVKRLAS